jgi:lysophospholipase L1-like esterase
VFPQGAEKALISKFSRIGVVVRDAWLILGITCVLVLFIEIALSVAFYYRDFGGDDYRVSADTYQNSDWLRKYYKEFHESNNSQWSSYVYWRRKPYRGEYINIDSRGIRKTWSPTVEQGSRLSRPKIFFFGGSTMWGSGARDDFTIPSSFAKQLAARGIDAEVINFGESGYVSTQEMIVLIRELQKGNIPDLVIFYDGANDAYSAYQQRRAGLPQNEFNRVQEFNSSIWSRASNDLSIIRLINGIFARLKSSAHSENAVENKALADDVLDVYEKNVEIISALAERYSFKALFYWQPTIFDKKNLTEYEENERQRLSEMRPFLEVTNKSFRQRDFARNAKSTFHDLSLLFADVREPLFLDWCHLGETGNEYVAERFVKDALSIIGEWRPVAQEPERLMHGVSKLDAKSLETAHDRPQPVSM